MKLLQALLLCALVGLSSHNLLADAVQLSEFVNGKEVLVNLKPNSGPVEDPRIRVHRLQRGSVPFHGFSFSFLSVDGAGSFNFFNANKVALGGLSFTITPGGPAAGIEALFACGVGSELSVLPFSNCVFSQTGNTDTVTVVDFFGAPGLPAFSHFAVDLTGFEPNTVVSAVATPLPTPEPAPSILLLTGIGALIRKRRLPKGKL